MTKHRLGQPRVDAPPIVADARNPVVALLVLSAALTVGAVAATFWVVATW